ncbi:MAG TPA: aminotransferase class V-fold PLP-dependent enzyme, partial [Ignavibacteriaceae bacterium]|nr:aminotransferase class V-fold PLP-dependent enzyme [Ignavibacteriaceae bacterium]
MQKRIYNFSAGPAILPEEVLKEAQENLFSLPGVGMSILEISHRSKTFDKIIEETKEDLRSLLDISDNYEILFLQGGASLQFSMVPLNLMPPKNKADYILTGSWSK